MLHWDMSAMMPKGGTASRTDQLAVLKTLHHSIITDSEIPELLDGAEQGEHLDAWQQARMRAGLGAEDSPARFLQNYIDDSLAASLADRVVLPPQWAHMHPKDETTRAATAATTAVGGRPSHPYSRAAVHCRVAAGVYAALGFDVSISKTQAGTKVASLGLRTAADTRRVDCPPIKAAAIKEQAEAILRQIRPGGRVEFKPLERLTGRLNHIAQVAPELKPYLRYAHAALSGAGGGRKAERRASMSSGSAASCGGRTSAMPSAKICAPPSGAQQSEGQGTLARRNMRRRQKTG